MNRPCVLSSKAVRRLILKCFPFKSVNESTIKELVSYDDRNYYFQGERLEHSHSSLNEYVLKLTNSQDTPEIVSGLSQILLYLKNKGFSCPYPILNKTGDDTMIVLSGEQLQGFECADSVLNSQKKDVVFTVRVLVFVPGELFANVPVSKLLFFKVGFFIGSMDRDLQNLEIECITCRTYDNWDVKNLPYLRKYLPSVLDDHKRKMAETVFDNFEKHVIPTIPHLQKGIIHNDANDMNIIMQKNSTDEYDVAGIIDFGDCMVSCYVFELAIMMAYSMVGKENPVETVVPMLAGYLNAFPLPDRDLDCLFYAVLGRLAQSCVNGEHQYRLSDGNEYILITVKPAWALIELLLEKSKTEVEQVWAGAREKSLQDFIH